MYNGEVQIFQQNLDRFLSIAQRLKLEGLLENGSETDEHQPTPKETNDYIKETLSEQTYEEKPSTSYDSTVNISLTNDDNNEEVSNKMCFRTKIYDDIECLLFVLTLCWVGLNILLG